MTLGVYIRNPFSVHLQCFSVCIIGDFSVRESVLAFLGREEEEEEACFPAGSGRPSGRGQAGV